MSEKERFASLLSPFQIQQVKLKNRIVCAGHARLFVADDGSVTDVMIASYQALATGGVGMIVMGQTTVDFPMGAAKKRNVIHDDRLIPGFRKLTAAIHKEGCPVFLQISHVGPAQHARDYGLPPVSASTLREDEKPAPAFESAKELAVAEIEDITTKFALAAERASKAGFDGVEVHGAHSYLINSFLSRAWNKRQDAYGCQDFVSRARFGVEVIRAIKSRLGTHFPVGIRVNGQEFGLEKGITPAESQEFAKIFQEAGADYISVSGYGYGSYKLAHYPEQIIYPEITKATAPLAKIIKKPGLLVSAAMEIKKVVSIPVIAVGRLDPELGEWILQQNGADLIGMVRRLIADPELPRKVIERRLDDIAPCTACVECGSYAEKNEPIRCRINATMGKELECVIGPAQKKKRVVVIGGGPSGMEAARVAALRGHDVTLYEKERKLGGLLPLAALVKGLELEDLPALVRYFEGQMKKLGVRVIRGKSADIALIESIKPDAVIIATGGKPAIPEIPGAKRRGVLTGAALHHMSKMFLRFFSPRVLRWLTNFWMPVGKKVVVIGGLIEGCEMAEFMVKRGREVTVVENSTDLGAGIPERNKGRLINWLTAKGVTMLKGVKYEEITEAGLTVTVASGERKTIAADSLLFALPSQPDTAFFEALRGRVAEVYVAGDCAEPRKIIDAVNDGMRIGLSV